MPYGPWFMEADMTISSTFPLIVTPRISDRAEPIVARSVVIISVVTKDST